MGLICVGIASVVSFGIETFVSLEDEVEKDLRMQFGTGILNKQLRAVIKRRYQELNTTSETRTISPHISN